MFLNKLHRLCKVLFGSNMSYEGNYCIDFSQVFHTHFELRIVLCLKAIVFVFKAL